MPYKNPAIPAAWSLTIKKSGSNYASTQLTPTGLPWVMLERTERPRPARKSASGRPAASMTEQCWSMHVAVSGALDGQTIRKLSDAKAAALELHEDVRRGEVTETAAPLAPSAEPTPATVAQAEARLETAEADLATCDETEADVVFEEVYDARAEVEAARAIDRSNNATPAPVAQMEQSDTPQNDTPLTIAPAPAFGVPPVIPASASPEEARIIEECVAEMDRELAEDMWGISDEAAADLAEEHAQDMAAARARDLNPMPVPVELPGVGPAWIVADLVSRTILCHAGPTRILSAILEQGRWRLDRMDAKHLGLVPRIMVAASRLALVVEAA